MPMGPMKRSAASPNSARSAARKARAGLRDRSRLILLYSELGDFNNRGPVAHRYSLYINDDEFLLVQDDGAAESVKYGPYYRLRADGSGLAKKLVFEPLLKKLKSKDLNVRRQAVYSLKELGPAIGSVAPDLITMLKSGDRDIQEGALEAMAQFGPECGRVVPTLIVLLRDPKFKQVQQQICETLMKIGPPARDALPALREIQAKNAFGTEPFNWSTHAIWSIERQ